jgi:hypothetical protein
MRKVLFVLILILVASLAQAKEPVTVVNDPIQNLEKIQPYWEEYVNYCKNDSTLYVYWVMTGQEKAEFKTDTTVVAGAVSKVAIIQPTMKREWVKENPTMDGLKKYLENKKK